MPTLNFLGKTYVQNHHLAVPHRQLIPKPDLSVASITDGQNSTCSLHDNLIVQGDNLEALKALLPTYSGKVKCIYIDPPYNTGNEGWVYNDNVKAPLIKEWLKKNELGKIPAVGKEGEDLTRHDKWLCMMTPRLKLLRELLTEDGVIFVSIDDNEQANLKLLMDEVFGDQNFISNIIWQKKYTQSNDAKYFSATHDFVICYGKNIELANIGLIDRTEEQNARYTNPDNDPRGGWKATPLHAKSGSNPTEIIFENGTKWTPPAGTYNRYSLETIRKAEKEGRLYFNSNTPVMKSFLNEMKDGVIPKTLWMYDEVGSNDSAKSELKDIFPENPFATPKPTTLIKRILEIATNPGDIVLDSFAGSGTTAQAVLELNKEDDREDNIKRNRKFILVEMEDYANTITAERVRRVIKGVPNSRKEHLKAGLGGSFSYFQLGSAIEMEEILTGNNLPEWSEFARYLFYTATGEQWDEKFIKNQDTVKIVEEPLRFQNEGQNEGQNDSKSNDELNDKSNDNVNGNVNEIWNRKGSSTPVFIGSSVHYDVIYHVSGKYRLAQNQRIDAGHGTSNAKTRKWQKEPDFWPKQIRR
jgi:adenine-specific DNA-methyltransferase